MPPLEIAVSIGRGGFYVPRRFIVFTTRRHIDLILIPRHDVNTLCYSIETFARLYAQLSHNTSHVSRVCGI